MCSVPPASSLRISRSSHLALFSSSVSGIRIAAGSISRKRIGERPVVEEAGEERGPSLLGEYGLDPAPIEARVTLTLIFGTLGERGVRGVGGMGGDIGVMEVGDDRSASGGFRRELRGGRGGGEESSKMPNSEVGRERRESVNSWESSTGSLMFTLGTAGEGGKERAGEELAR